MGGWAAMQGSGGDDGELWQHLIALALQAPESTGARLPGPPPQQRAPQLRVRMRTPSRRTDSGHEFDSLSYAVLVQ